MVNSTLSPSFAAFWKTWTWLHMAESVAWEVISGHFVELMMCSAHFSSFIVEDRYEGGM